MDNIKMIRTYDLFPRVMNGSYFEHINDDAPKLPELQEGK